jgi:hypothetical protein
MNDQEFQLGFEIAPHKMETSFEIQQVSEEQDGRLLRSSRQWRDLAMVEATRLCLEAVVAAAEDRGASISGNRSTIFGVFISRFEFLITTTTNNKQHVSIKTSACCTTAVDFVLHLT